MKTRNSLGKGAAALVFGTVFAGAHSGVLAQKPGPAPSATPAAKAGKSDTAAKPLPPDDPYAAYVWPPPPDKPRIKLEAVYSGRVDVEGDSKLLKALLGASPKSPWDDLRKPHDVAFDPQGRVLVTDWATGALVRIDPDKRVYDVLGTQGPQKLAKPLGVGVGPDGTIYVADAAARKVVALKPDGTVRASYGKEGELANPTDAAASADGKRLYVTDSKAHQVVVFDAASGARVAAWGKVGTEPGQFYYPSSVAVGRDGSVYVVDQLNARVQVLSRDGEPLDQLGQLGVGFGDFTRPKGVAVDEDGLVYVADNAFNNIQIFDSDLTLLTFIGSGGQGPGAFNGLSGVAVRGGRIAAVDQLGHRLQIFRYIAPKTGD